MSETQARKRTAKKKAAKKRKVKKRDTQKSLQGTEDKKDRTLEKLGRDYAEARDNRMAYGQEEVSLKQRILKRMHDLKIEKYTSVDAGVEIEIVHEDEKIKVKEYKPPKDDAPNKE